MAKPDSSKRSGPDSQPDSRQKILAAAKEEFAQHGLAGARVDRIARKAGVNKAMLYYHFQSKDNLYRQTVGEIIAGNLGRISKEVSHKSNLDELLPALARQYAQLLGGDNTMRKVLLQELANPHPQVFELMAETIIKSGLPEIVITAIENETKSGQLRPVDLRHALASFMALNIGYIIVSPIVDRVLKVTDKEQFHNERTEAVVDLFLNGVKKK
jgi:TetR/AcrR family transcriptional regulator